MVNDIAVFPLDKKRRDQKIVTNGGQNLHLLTLTMFCFIFFCFLFEKYIFYQNRDSIETDATMKGCLQVDIIKFIMVNGVLRCNLLHIIKNIRTKEID